MAESFDKLVEDAKLTAVETAALLGFQAPPSWGGLHNSVGGAGGPWRPHVEKNQFLKKKIKKGRQNSKLTFSTS